MRTSTRSSMSSSRSTRRCLRQACRTWCGGFATRHRNGRASSGARLQRAKRRLAHARVEGVDWYWPAGDSPPSEADDEVRLLAPFDPVVWDRRRFELLWGWAYRFEAYTPVPKRKLGYYALPLLWRDRVIGWANLSVNGTALRVGRWLRRARRRAAAPSAAHSTRNWIVFVSFSDCRDSGPDVRCAAQSDRHTVSPIGDHHETRSIHFHPWRPRAVGGRRIRTRRRRISARSRSRPTR